MANNPDDVDSDPRAQDSDIPPSSLVLHFVSRRKTSNDQPKLKTRHTQYALELPRQDVEAILADLHGAPCYELPVVSGSTWTDINAYGVCCFEIFQHSNASSGVHLTNCNTIRSYKLPSPAVDAAVERLRCLYDPFDGATDLRLARSWLSLSWQLFAIPSNIFMSSFNKIHAFSRQRYQSIQEACRRLLGRTRRTIPRSPGFDTGERILSSHRGRSSQKLAAFSVIFLCLLMISVLLTPKVFKVDERYPWLPSQKSPVEERCPPSWKAFPNVRHLTDLGEPWIGAPFRPPSIVYNVSLLHDHETTLEVSSLEDVRRQLERQKRRHKLCTHPDRWIGKGYSFGEASIISERYDWAYDVLFFVIDERQLLLQDEGIYDTPLEGGISRARQRATKVELLQRQIALLGRANITLPTGDTDALNEFVRQSIPLWKRMLAFVVQNHLWARNSIFWSLLSSLVGSQKIISWGKHSLPPYACHHPRQASWRVEHIWMWPPALINDEIGNSGRAPDLEMLDHSIQWLLQDTAIPGDPEADREVRGEVNVGYKLWEDTFTWFVCVPKYFTRRLVWQCLQLWSGMCHMLGGLSSHLKAKQV